MEHDHLRYIKVSLRRIFDSNRGIWLASSIFVSRKRQETARELLADGIDSSQAKQEDKKNKISAAALTFEIIARQWLAKTASERAAHKKK